MAISSKLFHLLLLSSLGTLASATVFTVQNQCPYTVWPGFLSGNGLNLGDGGFSLAPSKSVQLTSPPGWSGRIWGRTGCHFDASGNGKCQTGDCGSLKCSLSGQPPATLAEFTIASSPSGMDFYDVSLVDGYNLPMLVVPRGGTGGGCSATGCLVDLNGACPSALRVARENGRGTVACRSACEAFADPRFCCSEAYSTPDTCGPSIYSLFFKYACPRAYSYAYDDKTSTYTCASADYMIIFCPSPYTSQKLLGARKDGAQLPLVNKTTMYMASQHASSSGR